MDDGILNRLAVAVLGGLLGAGAACAVIYFFYDGPFVPVLREWWFVPAGLGAIAFFVTLLGGWRAISFLLDLLDWF
jgi:hypothetical protein